LSKYWIEYQDWYLTAYKIVDLGPEQIKGVTKVTSSDDTTESITQDNEQDRNEAIQGKELAQLQTELMAY
jgi:hypothetical protein